MKMRKPIIWFHISAGLTVGAYFYSPLREVDWIVPFFQFCLLPALALSGLYLWQGHKLKKLLKG